MRAATPLVLAIVLLIEPVTPASPASASSFDLPLKEFLAEHGLDAYESKIKAIGVTTPSDIGWVQDADADSLWMPVVKRNLLKDLAENRRQMREAERRFETKTKQWYMVTVSSLFTTAETLMRGFFLGFGVSAVYEMLWVNKEFYTANEDIAARTRRAAFRGCALGTAVALLLVGSAIVVPSSWRGSWMDRMKFGPPY